MMITNEKFETPITAFRSRLISPVYSLDSDSLNICIGIKYNIFSSYNDGFKLLLENYIEPSEVIELRKVFGPMKINMWHSLEIQIRSLNFSQFRVSLFELFCIFSKILIFS
jgi:hypothetical protein